MSVNGGFATKAMDSQYNTQIYNLLYLLQYRIRKFYANEVVNENNFVNLLIKTYNKTIKLETSKYIPPRFSEAIKDLIMSVSETKASYQSHESPDQLNRTIKSQTRKKTQFKQVDLSPDITEVLETDDVIQTCVTPESSNTKKKATKIKPASGYKLNKDEIYIENEVIAKPMTAVSPVSIVSVRHSNSSTILNSFMN